MRPVPRDIGRQVPVSGLWNLDAAIFFVVVGLAVCRRLVPGFAVLLLLSCLAVEPSLRFAVTIKVLELRFRIRKEGGSLIRSTRAGL